MGFRIPATLVSPYARLGHVDHKIYRFESIIKMNRYRFGLAPLTPRDLYAHNIAYAFDFEHPHLEPPALPSPAHVISTACPGSSPIDSGGSGLDGGSLIGSRLPASDQSSQWATPRAKPHDLYTLQSSGYLERLGFHYQPATPQSTFRHPSSMGMTR